MNANYVIHSTQVTQYCLASLMYSLVNILKGTPRPLRSTESRTMHHTYNPPDHLHPHSQEHSHLSPHPHSNHPIQPVSGFSYLSNQTNPRKTAVYVFLQIKYSHSFKYCYWKGLKYHNKKSCFHSELLKSGLNRFKKHLEIANNQIHYISSSNK